MKIKISAFIWCATFLFSFSTLAQNKKVTVVIDAGHGGSDPGHLSNNKNHLAEKELNLLIANKVGGYIDQYLTNIEIIYTRKDDSFISLDDRVYKANSINADCFISIHCNANQHQIIHGTESHVHTMSSTKSVELAKIMEKEFSSRAGRHSRGVKDSEDREHTLQVLKYTSMTSVLLECGFLTNEKEANYLNTTSGQEILASAIFRGLRTFLQAEYPETNFVKAVKSTTTITTASSKTTGTTTTSKATGKFAIQIMSTREPVETDSDVFKKLGEKVIRQKVTTTSEFKYRYLVGSFETREAGNTVLKKVQTNGFKDAIIIQLE